MKSTLVLALALLGLGANAAPQHGAERVSIDRATASAKAKAIFDEKIADLKKSAPGVHTPDVMAKRAEFATSAPAKPSTRHSLEVRHDHHVPNFAVHVPKIDLEEHEARKLGECSGCGTWSYWFSYYEREDFSGWCDSLDGDYSCLDDCDSFMDESLANYLCECGYNPWVSYSMDTNICNSEDISAACLDATYEFIEENFFSYTYTYSIGVTMDAYDAYCSGALLCSMDYNDDVFNALDVNEAYYDFACECFGLDYYFSMSYSFPSMSFGEACENDACIDAYGAYIATWGWVDDSEEFIAQVLDVQCDMDVICSMSYSMKLLSYLGVNEDEVDYYCECGDEDDFCYQSEECQLMYLEMQSFSYSFSTGMALEYFQFLECVTCSMSYDMMMENIGFGSYLAYFDAVCACGADGSSPFVSFDFENIDCDDEECYDATVEFYEEFYVPEVVASLSYSISSYYWVAAGFVDIFICDDFNAVCESGTNANMFWTEIMGVDDDYTDYFCACEAYDDWSSMEYSMSYCDMSYGCTAATIAAFTDYSYEFSTKTYMEIHDYDCGEYDQLCASSLTDDFLTYVGTDSATGNLVCDCLDYISFSYNTFHDLSEQDAIFLACDVSSSSDCYNSVVDWLVSEGYAADDAAAMTLIDTFCTPDPTPAPTGSAAPTYSTEPTSQPTAMPTAPTSNPTMMPTMNPTTPQPTVTPGNPTRAPTTPSPTAQPTAGTDNSAGGAVVVGWTSLVSVAVLLSLQMWA